MSRCVIALILILGSVSVAARSFETAVSASVDTNLAGLDEAGHAASFALSLSPLWRASETLSLAAQLALSRDLSGEGEASIQDGLVSAGFGSLKLGKSVGLRGQASLSLPLSEDSRERAGLLTTLSFGPAFSLPGSALGLSALSLGYRISVLRSFHRYTTSTTGRSNTAWGLSHRLDAGFRLSPRLQLSLAFGTATTWTYEGAAQSSLRTAQELSLEVTKSLSMELGHSRGGPLYRPDGETPNLALYSRDSSSIYGGVTYVF